MYNCTVKLISHTLRNIIPLVFIVNLNLQAQAPDSVVQYIINDVNLDTLVSYVRALSGEDSVSISGQRYLITSRKYNATTHTLSADYIKQKLVSFGLTTYDQYFASGTGRNIYAVQPGTMDTSIQYIVCAHYDGVTNFGADDNASGTAAVLETARLLSKIPTFFTVVYALWDQEEIGLIGSAFYASTANLQTKNIQGVINLDMLGWDSNSDGKCDIHTKNVANSVNLAYTLKNIDSVYNLDTNPIIYNPGTTASDHSSFWNYNYSAILLIEAYYGGDFNPNLHQPTDRIGVFNLNYFHNMSKLAAGGIAYLAHSYITGVKDIENVNRVISLKQNYPNPANPGTVIEFTLAKKAFTTLKIYNSLGQEIATLLSGELEEGAHKIFWNAARFSSGIYLYCLQSGSFVETKKLTLLK
jgi:hypothetical protein